MSNKSLQARRSKRILERSSTPYSPNEIVVGDEVRSRKQLRHTEAPSPEQEMHGEGDTNKNNMTESLLVASPDVASPKSQPEGTTGSDHGDAVNVADNARNTPSTPGDLTLSQRRQIRSQLTRAERQNVQSPSSSPTSPSSASQDSVHNSGVTSPFSVADFNQYKLRVIELTREKNLMTNAVEAMTEKCQGLEKIVREQKQQLMSFEELVKQTKSKGRKSTKKGAWTSADDRSCISAYKGIKFQLDLIVNKHASLVVTESILSRDGRFRFRDWTKSAVVVSRDIAESSVLYVQLPDGSLGIRTSAMARAKESKFYVNRYDSISEFVQDVTKLVLSGSSGNGMSSAEKDDCVSSISSYPPILSKFRAALREETNNCKQSAKSSYLKSLGYEHSHLGESKKESEKEVRTREKQLVYDRCVKHTSADKPDTSYWRLQSLSDICSKETDCSATISIMRRTEEKLIESDVVDTLFMNEPARIAFNNIRGYSTDEENNGSNDVSILLIARADAWMTSCLQNIRVTGKGGGRSNQLLQNYESLVQLSLENLIKDVWEDINTFFPLELMVSFSNLSGPNNLYGNNNREWTVVLESPEDGYLYLLVTPRYLNEKVCSWMGSVKDFQIGRAKKTDEKFEVITRTMNFNCFEESDLDDPEIDNITSNN